METTEELKVLIGEDMVSVFLLDRSNAELESFHNHILMYVSFSPPVHAAGVLLAGPDYNQHVHRPARRKADGSIQYGKVNNNSPGGGAFTHFKQDTGYSYNTELQSAVPHKKLSAGAL